MNICALESSVHLDLTQGRVMGAFGAFSPLQMHCKTSLSRGLAPASVAAPSHPGSIPCDEESSAEARLTLLSGNQP